MNLKNFAELLINYYQIIKLRYNIFQLLKLIALNTIITIYDIATLLSLPLAISVFLNPTKIIFGVSLSSLNYTLIIEILFILFLFRFILLLILSKTNSNFIWNITERLNNKVFHLYINLPYIDFSNKKISRLVRDVTGEVTAVSQVSYSVITAFSEFLILFITFFLFLFYDFKLALITLLLFTLIFLFINKIVSKKINISGQRRVKEERRMYDLATNSFIGIKEIISNELYLYFTQSYKHLVRERSKACNQQMHFSIVPRIIFEFLVIICILFVLFYYVVFVGKNLNSVITFIAGLTAIAFRVLPGISRLMNSIQSINFNKLTILHYSNILKLEFVDSKKPIFISTLKDETFIAKDVSFSYHNSSVKFSIPYLKLLPGQVIGISGKSGSGKSTLISLILGLYKVDKGSFSYNKTIKSISDIGYVDQRVQILEESFFFNVTFLNAISEASIIRFENALKMSGLADFYKDVCDSNPMYELKMLGENISGGQAQRIGIARALFKNSPFLILDEFTSSLDLENENKLLKLVSDLKINRSILIVTHSANVLNSCDITYKLENNSLCI